MKQSQLKNKQQAGRFIVVGVINTALDFSLLFVLKHLGLPTIPANFVSSTLAFLFSFTVNRSYTFKAQPGNLARQITLFIVVTLVGLWVIQNLIISVLEPSLSVALANTGLGLLIAKIIATIVSMTWNYVLYTLVVFPHKNER